MSDFVLDASLALQWFLEDEADRNYSLAVVASLSEKRALVPVLWFYEIGNGLVMAYRRQRIAVDQIQAFLLRLKELPIDPRKKYPPRFLNFQTLRKPTVSRTMTRPIWPWLFALRFRSRPLTARFANAPRPPTFIW